MNHRNDLDEERFLFPFAMEWRALKNVNNCLFTNVYTYLETSGGKS